MSVTKHPGEENLMAYASGRLGEAWSIAIATHLTFCPSCRRAVGDFEKLAGNFLSSTEPVGLAASALDQVMARLERDGAEIRQVQAACESATAQNLLPAPLAEYFQMRDGKLPWKRLGLGAYHIPIKTGDPGGFARLLRVPAGKPVPEHGHVGPELTLVLSGSFRDKGAYFGPGDLQEADADCIHQPHADPGEDCICLAVTSGPLRFTSFAARLVQPFAGI